VFGSLCHFRFTFSVEISDLIQACLRFCDVFGRLCVLRQAELILCLVSMYGLSLAQKIRNYREVLTVAQRTLKKIKKKQSAPSSPPRPARCRRRTAGYRRWALARHGGGRRRAGVTCFLCWGGSRLRQPPARAAASLLELGSEASNLGEGGAGRRFDTARNLRRAGSVARELRWRPMRGSSAGHGCPK
jgi:hypothetical protein